MTFSFRGLDIRRRLPDRKGKGISRAPESAITLLGVSTPQDGASPSRLHHRTSPTELAIAEPATEQNASNSPLRRDDSPAPWVDSGRFF